MRFTDIAALCGLLILYLGSLGYTQQSSSGLSGETRIAGRVRIVGSSAAVPQGIVVTLRELNTSAQTEVLANERGEFAFAGISVGRFKLIASRPGYVGLSYGATRPQELAIPLSVVPGTRIENLDLVLLKEAAISGTVRDRLGMPAASIEVYLEQWAYRGGEPTVVRVPRASRSVTDDEGHYRLDGLAPGRYLVSAGRSGLVGSSDYARTYHPSTTSTRGANEIVLGAGEEIVGADVTLILSAVNRIDGTVASSFGKIERLSLWCHQIDSSSFRSPIPVTLSDAGFHIPNVPQGDYVIEARALIAAGGDRPLTGWTHWASARFSLGHDMPPTSIHLELSPMTYVQGTIQLNDPTSRGVVPPLNGVVVQLVAADKIDIIDVPAAVASRDGSFTIHGVAPGRFWLRPTLPARFRVASIRSAATGDLADIPLEVTPDQPVVGVVVSGTTASSELAGTVFDVSNQPTADYAVVVFPKDRTLWVPQSRRISATRPDSLGRYLFAGLPPGDYSIAAVANLVEGEWMNPELLQTLVTASVPVKLIDGARNIQDLRSTK